MPKLDTEEKIRTTIDARANAIRNKNVQDVRACFTEDSVGFYFAPPLRESPHKDDLAGWFASWHGSIGYEMREQTITSDDDIAYCHGLCHLTGTRTDGTGTDVWYRETLCFRKIGDQWQITHIHESVPMYMDGTFKAAIDLKPSEKTNLA
jgi:ketosteroid isomerase-like protein